MKIVGVRDLKAHISELVREVEGGEVVEITNRGRVVARIVPPVRPLTPDEAQATMQSIRDLGARISAKWPEGVSALEALNDERG